MLGFAYINARRTIIVSFSGTGTQTRDPSPIIQLFCNESMIGKDVEMKPIETSSRSCVAIGVSQRCPDIPTPEDSVARMDGHSQNFEGGAGVASKSLTPSQALTKIRTSGMATRTSAKCHLRSNDLDPQRGRRAQWVRSGSLSWPLGSPCPSWIHVPSLRISRENDAVIWDSLKANKLSMYRPYPSPSHAILSSHSPRWKEGSTMVTRKDDKVCGLLTCVSGSRQ